MNHKFTEYIEYKRVSLSSKKENIGEKIQRLDLLIQENKGDLSFLKDKYIILGIPDDRGVIANGGNPGAKEGPQFFRNSFYKLYDTKIRTNLLKENNKNSETKYLSNLFIDAGDIILADTIAETHERLSIVIEEILKHNPSIIFVIGGGHDFSYGSYKGHIATRKNEVVPIINFDAHFDLRKIENGEINSGTAFNRIINDFPLNIHHGNALLEIGIQRDRNPISLYDFAVENKIKTIEYFNLLGVWQEYKSGYTKAPLEHIKDHLDECKPFGFNRYKGSIHLSLCLDVFDQSIAPGTSASTPFGAQIKELAQSISFFSRSSTCRVMDIAELCPSRDTLDMTSRLSATLVYRIALIREEHASR